MASKTFVLKYPQAFAFSPPVWKVLILADVFQKVTEVLVLNALPPAPVKPPQLR